MFATIAIRLTALGLLLGAMDVVEAAGTCYPLDSSFKSLGSYTYQSVGYCTDSCKAAGYSIAATTNGDSCLCSNSQPSGSSVSSSFCSETCSGYPSDNCGAANYMYVFSTGSGTVTGGTTTTGTKQTTAATTATTATGTATTPIPTVIYITTQGAAQQGTTIIRTVTPTPSATTSGRPASSAGSSSGSSNSSGGGIGGGAIAGIIIGVLVVLAVLGAVGFFFWRRRHDNDDDDSESGRAFTEKSRAGGLGGAGAAGGLAAVGSRPGKNGLTAGDASELRPPPAFDQRLDLGMVGRRNSSESLADNYDYSRKILRVVNH